MEGAGAECGHRGKNERGKGLRIKENSAAGGLGRPGRPSVHLTAQKGHQLFGQKNFQEVWQGGGERLPPETPAHLDQKHWRPCLRPAPAMIAPPGHPHAVALIRGRDPGT